MHGLGTSLATVLLLKLGGAYAVARVFRLDAHSAFLGAQILMPLDEIGYVAFTSTYARGC